MEEQVAWRVGEGEPTTRKTPTVAVPKTAGGLLLIPARLRVWGALSTLSLLDQGLTSGAGFGVNLLLGRWMPAEIYGAFAVAFAGLLFVSGFHNVLLLEPLSVLGPSRYADRLPAYFRAQIDIHTILVGVLSAVALLTGLVLRRFTPGSPLIGATVGAGLTLPFLLLLWLARRMCYVAQRPSIAAAGSALYLAFIVVGLFLLGHFGWLGSFTAFALMGCGSVLAAGLVVWRLGLLKGQAANEPGASWRTAFRENWTYGRWLVGSAVLFSVSSQTQTFLTAAELSLGSAGVLRAMQLPSLVMSQAVTATGLLFLPVFSRDFALGAIRRMRHKAMLVSFGLGAVALCFAGALTLFAGQTEHFLFGGKYAGYAWLIPLLALIPVSSGISTGYSLALRAAQTPHFDFVSNVFAAPIAAVSAFLFVRWWGLAGGAASMLLSFAVLSAVTLVFFKRSAQAQALSRNSGGVRP